MNTRFRFNDDGVAQITHSVLCVGDYGGTGTIEEANIRALQDREGAKIEYGHYHFRALWLPDNEDNREILRRLDNYPLIDDRIHSEVELDVS